MGKRRMRGLLGVALAAMLLFGCGQSNVANETGDNSNKIEGHIKRVGVAMPTQVSERWINDGANMQKKLQGMGYEVELQYADDDIDIQIEQVEKMIDDGVNCLVIGAIDSTRLVETEERAKEAGIPIIAYDRLLMDTDAVSYYATFDNKKVGSLIGQCIVEKAELEKAKAEGDQKTIEFFMGSPDDNNALFVYDGLMEQLNPYLEDGTLQCFSGKTSFEDTSILRWSQDTAKENATEILKKYYTDQKLDIACTVYDGFAYGVIDALEAAGYTESDWPMVTGSDAEIMAIKNIMEGKQISSLYKDTRILADKCTAMVQALLEGGEPEINDTEQYDNGKKIVPSYLCMPVIVDADNLNEVMKEQQATE